MKDNAHETTTRRSPDVARPQATWAATLDPVAFTKALAKVGTGLVRHPAAVTRALTRFGAGLAAASLDSASLLVGPSDQVVIPTRPDDRRFTERAWAENPVFFGLLQAHLLTERLSSDLVEAAGLEAPHRRKALFAARLLIDAVAPTNFVGTNPAVLKGILDTGGRSTVRGVRRFLDDLAHNRGRPSQVEAGTFQIGRDLAVTPGKVVFRNELMELIQYAPATETVHETPLLCSPPWINKYYIMDLAPGRSFAEWAVRRGHTVFAISYRNPDRSMRDLTLEDYLLRGPVAALDVIENITGAEQTNIAALCLGGTLTAMLLAHLAELGQHRVKSATLLNCLVDFTDPGELAVFTDPATVDRLERKMTRRGYLDGREMAATFDALRANDLIWNYVVNNWLLGQAPPAFDILTWNADTTRMPAAMHADYLRSCYVHNRLARGELELAGTPLRMNAVTQDLYVLGAEKDHITPWTASYRTNHLVAGSTRYVLTSSGHVAGIVNPPGGKGRYWTNEDLPVDPARWRAGAVEHAGSWWEDWSDWAAGQGGPLRKPPAIGSDSHPIIEDAPGRYVHER